MNKVAILVPAHNEQEVIEKTLAAIRKISKAKDIYVVDDGSTDATASLAKKYTSNVLVTTNHGKAYALNTGITKFSLTKKYDFIFFMDADTVPDRQFIEYAMKHFNKPKNKDLVCVVGRVKGFGTNWISRFRQWEYLLSHFIHKRAQENLKSILVVPGCATIYRSKIFKKLEFPSGTLTEDMDFTFKMHRNGFNRMIFEDRAIVYTQDPQTLKDFSKQLKRWYTGFWQVVKKYNIPWQGQLIDLEAGMLALEGLYNGIIVISILIAIIPLLVTGHLYLLILPAVIDLFIFFIPTLIWSSIVDRDYLRVFYFPQFYFLRFLASLIFLQGFYLGFISQEKEYSWNTNRYIARDGKEVI